MRHGPHGHGADLRAQQVGGLRFRRLRRTVRPHPGLDHPPRRENGWRGARRLPSASDPDRRPKARIGHGRLPVGPHGGSVAPDLGHPRADRGEGQVVRQVHQGYDPLAWGRDSAPAIGCPLLQRRVAPRRRSGRTRRPAVQSPMGDDARRPGIRCGPGPPGLRSGRHGHREHGRCAHAVPCGRGAAHARPAAIHLRPAGHRRQRQGCVPECAATPVRGSGLPIQLRRLRRHRQGQHHVRRAGEPSADEPPARCRHGGRRSRPRQPGACEEGGDGRMRSSPPAGPQQARGGRHRGHGDGVEQGAVHRVRSEPGPPLALRQLRQAGRRGR